MGEAKSVAKVPVVVNTANKPELPHKHWSPKPRTSAVLFCLLAKKARTKLGKCEALVVKGHISNPWR
jgi:hypothetical protein